jgi:hypothetical protein
LNWLVEFELGELGGGELVEFELGELVVGWLNLVEFEFEFGG